MSNISKLCILITACLFSSACGKVNVRGGLFASTTKATSSSTPVLSVTSGTLTKNFGSVAQGAYAAYETYTITNSGSASATLCSVTAPSGFDLTSNSINYGTNTCGVSGTTVSIAAAATCSFTVRPAPAGGATLGLTSGTTSVSCAETTSDTINLSYTVIASTSLAGMVKSISSSYIGNTPINTTSTSIAVYQLNSHLGYDLTGCNFVGSKVLTNPTDFRITTGVNACGSTIADNSTCLIYVEGTPKSAGVKTSDLIFSCQDNGTFTSFGSLSYTGTIPIMAWTGVASIPASNAATINLGSLSRAVSPVAQFLVYNIGEPTGTNCAITPTTWAPGAVSFTLGATASIVGNGSNRVDVTLSPTSPLGTYNTNFTATCDGGYTATTSVTLTVAP